MHPAGVNPRGAITYQPEYLGKNRRSGVLTRLPVVLAHHAKFLRRRHGRGRGGMGLVIVVVNGPRVHDFHLMHGGGATCETGGGGREGQECGELLKNHRMRSFEFGFESVDRAQSPVTADSAECLRSTRSREVCRLAWERRTAAAAAAVVIVPMRRVGLRRVTVDIRVMRAPDGGKGGRSEEGKAEDFHGSK